MSLMFILVSLAMILSVALMIINISLAKKEHSEREKPSPFECGFDPISSARLPFSIQFFLITVIFLIFDVEITLILPVVQLVTISLSAPLLTLIMIFTLILLLGLYLEWNQGALEWYF